MLANAMLADPLLTTIPVNIFAIDPVPGMGNFQTESWLQRQRVCGFLRQRRALERLFVRGSGYRQRNGNAYLPDVRATRDAGRQCLRKWQ
jgi:hypothetical protein